MTRNKIAEYSIIIFEWSTMLQKQKKEKKKKKKNIKLKMATLEAISWRFARERKILAHPKTEKKPSIGASRSCAWTSYSRVNSGWAPQRISQHPAKGSYNDQKHLWTYIYNHKTLGKIWRWVWLGQIVSTRYPVKYETVCNTFHSAGIYSIYPSKQFPKWNSSTICK